MTNIVSMNLLFLVTIQNLKKIIVFEHTQSIGDNCLLGKNIQIGSNVSIGDNVLIGTIQLFIQM